ncbi:hypothetical protein BsWGS_16004 [Bradybaena similaris]
MSKVVPTQTNSVTTSKVVPTQKYGYVDIKQASKVKPRKLKSWKHRWAVLTKMSDLSNEEYVAKLDLYDNEAEWRGNSSDKTTFVLEKVTCVRPVKSKTHKHAFEVIERLPVLVISGCSELDSYSWIVSLQQIFTPDQVEAKQDCYHVFVAENEHSTRWRLSGAHTLIVSASGLSLGSLDGHCVMSWGLNTLVRFHVEHSSEPGQRPSLVIECGPKSTTGHSFFSLLSDEAEDIMGAIKHYICLALTVKQNARTSSVSRHRSASVTTSEKSFQRLLDSQTAAHHMAHSEPQPIPMPRSDSSSSNSTSNFDSSGRSTRLSNSPGSSLITGHFSGDFASFLEMEETSEPDFCQTPTNPAIADASSGEVTAGCRRRSSSHPDNPYIGNHDYSEIKDIADELRSVSRRNTISCEPAEVDFDRLRSVSAVVASLKASNNGGDTSRVLPPSSQNKDEDKSDFDSAISSMALSVANEELPLNDEPHCCEAVCADNQCSCLLARRRSSSTPDLQAFWKINRFENVYEELDELRASVQRLNKKRDSVVPPQLPARPVSVNSTHRIHPDIKATAPMNKPLMKMRGALSLDESESRTDRPCLCADRTTATRPAGDGQCAVCRWQGANDRSKPSACERSPRHNQIDSLLSTINDINSIILQVQSVKRRRSDITPLAASLVSTVNSDINYAKITSQQPQREDTARSVRSVFTAPGDLIDLQDTTDNFDLLKPPSESVPSQEQSNISDSLIHFFLDDEDFSSEPAVTSEGSAQPADSLGHLTRSSCNVRTSPPSDKPSLTPAHKTCTWPGPSSRHETNTGLARPLGHDILVDIWGLDTRHLSGSADAMDASFQDFFASSFSREPLI